LSQYLNFLLSAGIRRKGGTMTETTERIIQEKHYDLEQKKLRMKQLEDVIEDVKNGEATVSDPLILGMVISEYNALEREMRHGYAALYKRCNPIDKTDVRSLVVGYYVNDEGYAIDPSSKQPLEKLRGELLNNSPDKLMLSSVGSIPLEIGETYIGMITRNDLIAIKEYLSNHDIPISDGINTLYTQLGFMTDWDKLDLPERMETVRKLWKEIGRSVALSAYHQFKGRPSTMRLNYYGSLEEATVAAENMKETTRTASEEMKKNDTDKSNN